MSSPRRAVTVRTRLIFVAGLCAVLALVPTVMVSTVYLGALQDVRAERAALPVNRAWQAVLTQVQAHRRAAVTPGAGVGSPDARAAAARAREAFQAVSAALEAARATQARQESARRLAQGFDALATADGPAGPMAGPVLERYHQFTTRVLDEVQRTNADSGLLLDAEPEAHQTILAGLQLAPPVGEALAELGAVAAAVAVDDTALVAAAATRYRVQVHALEQALRQAGDASPALARDFAPVLARLQSQRNTVEQTLAAAAADLNYPLDKMSAAFGDAARLQAGLSDDVTARVQQALDARTSRMHWRLWALGAAVLAGLGFVAGVLWRTVQGILRPVMTVVEAAERIADGDLTRPVPPSRGDEIGRVLQAMDVMQARLRQMVEQIHEASERMTQAAVEIASGNQALSQRTEQTASNLQQAASEVELLGGAAQAGAGSAQHACQLASEASAAARQGGEVVAGVVQTMQGIHGSSQRIAEITGVIDGIAFQTNILALNAAVEAARAGDHGRGFAVVAGEVRTLAQRSAQAAREIKGLIQDSVERIEDGSRQAGRAGERMGEIVHRIAEVTAVMDGIAETVQQQAGGMTRMATSVTTIDAMTQQNAAQVEESAAATAALSQQAARMHNLINSFRWQ